MAPDLIAELTRPEAYSDTPAGVRHLETHISHLFFTGDRVYKVKKAVDLGFLDQTALATREHLCHEEVRLNRRMAGEIYRGVVPIRRGADGHLLVDQGPGAAVEWAVEMEQLPAPRMLDAMLDRGDVDNELIRRLATRIHEFHASAATGKGVDEFGSLATVRSNCEENFAQTSSFDTISPRLHTFLRERCLSFLDDNAGLIERRVREGRIREGHGDLHAGNLCILDDRIIAYDCIEFAARFRCSDVTADLAFLMMDLDLRRFRAFSAFLLHAYVERSGDEEMPALVDFYKGYRAYVRLKVESMAGHRERAMSYAHLAASYELGPALVLCCGLPGSGKSYTAQHLARPFEGVVLESDTTRKRLAGMEATRDASAPVGAGIYGDASSDDTYSALRTAAARHLEHGRTVFVDAGFRSRARRAPFADLARQTAVPFRVVFVDPPEDLILSRLEARSGTPSTSDAGVEVYRALAAHFEPPTEFDPEAVLRYDGRAPLPDLTAQLLDRLLP